MSSNAVPSWFVFKLFLALVKGLDRLRAKITPPPLRLLEMIGGYAPTQIIRAAAELGIADQLAAGPKTIPALAIACGADEKALARLMPALCTLEVFRPYGAERFELATLGEYLRSDRPDTLRATVIATGREQYGGMAGLTESMRSGGESFSSRYGAGFFPWLAREQDSGRHFHDSMTEISRACAPAFLAEYDFTHVHRIVDVGGGMGELLKAILRRHPRIEGTLFDVPAVIERARQDPELASRCTFVSGDMFREIPKGGDTYLFQRVIHDCDDVNAVRILSNCRSAMPPNCRLILLEPGIGRDGDEFYRYHADLLMLALLGGKERTADEYRQILNAAGFKYHCMIETRSPLRIVEAFA